MLFHEIINILCYNVNTVTISQFHGDTIPLSSTVYMDKSKRDKQKHVYITICYLMT